MSNFWGALHIRLVLNLYILPQILLSTIRNDQQINSYKMTYTATQNKQMPDRVHVFVFGIQKEKDRAGCITYASSNQPV